MRTWLWVVGIFSVFLIFCATTKGESVSERFIQANKLYEQGRFSEAAQNYQGLIDTGSVSAALYYNLGNAFFQSGELGRAIFAYQKAQELAPRDPEVNANLEFARNQATGGQTAGVGWSKRFIQKLTLNEWAVLAAISVGLWFVLLAVRQWQVNDKKPFSKSLFFLGFTSAVLLVCLSSAIYQQFYVQDAVVIVSEAVVRRGPFDESPSQFTLRDGAEVKVIERQADWMNVADRTGRVGWVREQQLLSLRTF